MRHKTFIESKERKKRRYYLHRRVRGFARVFPRKKMVEYPAEDFSKLTEKQTQYLQELRSYNYIIQKTLSI